MRALIAIGLTFLVCGAARPAASQTTGRLLDIQPGARENGLGAAGVALAGDPSDALWWNPAALAFAQSCGAQYTHAQLVPGLADDVMYNYAAGGIPVGKNVGIGASGTFLNYGAFAPAVSTEWSCAGAVGYRVLPELAAGLTAKYIQMQTRQRGIPSSGFAADLGALYRKPLRSTTLSAGFNLQNLGPDVKSDLLVPGGRTSRPLGRNLKLGGAATWTRPLKMDWEAGGTLVADFNQSLVTSEFRTYHFGAEIRVAYESWATAAIRGGYYDDPLGEIQDATYGAGVQIFGAAVDFASFPQASDLQNVHKWTFSFHTDQLMNRLAGQ